MKDCKCVHILVSLSAMLHHTPIMHCKQAWCCGMQWCCLFLHASVCGWLMISCSCHLLCPNTVTALSIWRLSNWLEGVVSKLGFLSAAGQLVFGCRARVDKLVKAYQQRKSKDMEAASSSRAGLEGSSPAGRALERPQCKWQRQVRQR